METTVSLLIELPELLLPMLKAHMDQTGKNQDQVFTTAIALYLSQQQIEGHNSQVASRIYLDSIFTIKEEV